MEWIKIVYFFLFALKQTVNIIYPLQHLFIIIPPSQQKKKENKIVA